MKTPDDSTDLTATARVHCESGPPVPETDYAGQRSRKRELLAEQQGRWVEGDPAPPEDFLARWPSDPESDPDVASLLAKDLFERRRRGESVCTDEYSERFPKHRDSLAALVSRQELLCSFGSEDSDASSALRFPNVGDDVFSFRLRHELGDCEE